MFFKSIRWIWNTQLDASTWDHVSTKNIVGLVPCIIPSVFLAMWTPGQVSQVAYHIFKRHTWSRLSDFLSSLGRISFSVEPVNTINTESSVMDYNIGCMHVDQHRLLTRWQGGFWLMQWTSYRVITELPLTVPAPPFAPPFAHLISLAHPSAKTFATPFVPAPGCLVHAGSRCPIINHFAECDTCQLQAVSM